MYARQLTLASLALLFCLSSAPAVKADEIAVWNFNDSNLIVDRGQGTLTTTANPANITFLPGTIFLVAAGDPAGMALFIQAGENLQNNGSILLVRVSTVGFTNITVSWASQRSDTGFFNLVVQNSSDGGMTFDGLGMGTPATNFWAGGHITFFPGPQTSNNPLFTLRFTMIGATSEAGTLGFDNIVISGTQIVPEPATMLLLGAGSAGVAAEVRRRRRSRK